MRISRRRRHFRRPPPPSPGAQYRANERIASPTVIVIDENGENLGELPTAKAIQIAQERELDLVEVSPLATPPVCKFIDYGAFKYQKEKEARKQKAHTADVKGIRLSPRIGDHDLDIRVKQAAGFLEDGDKVKVELPLRGRERQFADLARGVIQEFVAKLNAILPVKMEGSIEKQDNRLTAVISKR